MVRTRAYSSVVECRTPNPLTEVRILVGPPSRASTRPVAKTSIGLDKKLVSKNSTYLGRIF